ncbi:DUF5808 domain-containing protein [Amycolatopsis sp. NPDC051061]|uniref:DUF5808 domain-containing protein n=1 Tax=Amycolatopsis sp. NPDC051061 TaxID=3155042 RepID=UPI0034191DF3
MAGPEEPIEPQGHAAGVPYDWRRPSAKRFRARVWNPADRRFWTPKSFGWGYDLNFYWVAHPLRYFRR